MAHSREDIRATTRIALSVEVLILGGTQFLGRHLVTELRDRGHTVTLFNTGKNPGNAPPEVAQVHGRRETDLARLASGTWDAVIDTCGYVPAQLETSTAYLRGRAKQYVFISSISALDLSGQSADEQTPLLTLPEGASPSEMIPETYGALKALCEAVVQNAFGENALVVRPGLIVGPYDPTDRFTYWPYRVARGGAILAPVGPQYFVQFIDARDLAGWIVLQIEKQTNGAFDLTGPPHTVTIGDVLQAAMHVANTDPSILYASEDFLKEHDVGEWIDLPLWVASWSEVPAILKIDTKRAFETGLQLRPLEQTIADTLQWANRRGLDYEWKAGLTAEREAEILLHLVN